MCNNFLAHSFEVISVDLWRVINASWNAGIHSSSLTTNLISDIFRFPRVKELHPAHPTELHANRFVTLRIRIIHTYLRRIDSSFHSL